MKLPPYHHCLCQSALALASFVGLGNTVAFAANVVPENEPLILVAEAQLHAGLRGRASAQPLVDANVNLADQDAPAPALAHWSAVDTSVLDEMRGGFDTPLQLKLSFGIERAVYLNGALVTTTSFNLPGLGSVTPENQAALSVASGSVSLLQNGPGNSFALSPTSTPAAATIIQNTLNNQSIQGLTTINATANSLELLRLNGFQGLIRDGLSNAIVPH